MRAPGGAAPDWRVAERAFDDDVIGMGTLPEMIEAAVERRGEAPAQRIKGGVYDRSLAPLPDAPDGAYADVTYDEMARVIRRLAAGFRDLGVGADDRVAICADTRAEWALTDFAVLAAGGVVSTIYTDSSDRQTRYLLEDAGATGVVVENEAILARVLPDADDLDLSFVVAMDTLAEAYDDAPVAVFTLGDVHERGADRFDRDAYDDWLASRDLGDLASVIYTSGTTGQPKGVALTHRNFRTNVNQVYRRLGPRPDKDDDLATLTAETDTVSFLPLAHVFERLAGHFLVYGVGGTVGYAESVDTIAEDLHTLSPSAATVVPRVYERIFDRMHDQAAESRFGERVFEWAADVARTWTRTDDPGIALRAQHAAADRLVYRRLRAALGGDVEFMISGGGSLSADLAAAFQGMGVTVIEGYGLTETSPVVTVNPPEDVRPGTLGVPVDGLDVAIDRTAADPERFDGDGPVGELLVRGPNVAPGYWRHGAISNQTYRENLDGDAVTVLDTYPDNEGRPWFPTGDLVEATDDGFLVYHDRVKQLLVLSTGKNVAPQRVEDAVGASDRVDQVMAVGDGRKFVGALIVPNFERARRWADREGIDLPDDDEALCSDERVRAWIGDAVESTNATLERVERVKEFALVPEEWTAENGLLTPSMKKKRHNIREAYADRIDDLYATASPPD